MTTTERKPLPRKGEQGSTAPALDEGAKKVSKVSKIRRASRRIVDEAGCRLIDAITDCILQAPAFMMREQNKIWTSSLRGESELTRVLNDQVEAVKVLARLNQAGPAAVQAAVAEHLTNAVGEVLETMRAARAAASEPKDEE